jgi:hypothetical protein
MSFSHFPITNCVRVSTAHGDEEAVQQILTAMATLVQTYIAID